MNHVVSLILRLARIFETNKWFYNLEDFSLNKTNGICSLSMELGRMEVGLINLEHSRTGTEMKKDDYLLMTVIHMTWSHSDTGPLHMVS